VDRRAFMATLLATALTAPPTAGTQPVGKVPRIGLLAPAPSPLNIAALRLGLRDLGYEEPSSLILEIRSGDGRLDRLPGFAAELVQLGVDIIVTDSTAATLAAKRATATIPIVMGTGSSDPVARGLVASMARPGGNVTGLTLPALNGKRLELLKEAVPKLTRVAYVWNPANPVGKNDVADTAAAARTLGLQLHLVEVKIAGDLEAAFARAARDHAGGVLVMADFVLNMLRTQIVDLAARHRLPGIYEAREYVEAGGLLAYGVNVPANFRRAAELVGKILKGAKPAELPVENPARIELFVNLRTARALGLAIPQSLLLRADQVIE
jgi:putative tryptophan/tyrosine transport system substrate-binding protein